MKNSFDRQNSFDDQIDQLIYNLRKPEQNDKVWSRKNELANLLESVRRIHNHYEETGVVSLEVIE